MALPTYPTLIIGLMADQPADLSPSTLGAAPRRSALRSSVVRWMALMRHRRGLVVGSIAAVVFLLLILAITRALYGSAAWAYDFVAYQQ